MLPPVCETRFVLADPRQNAAFTLESRHMFPVVTEGFCKKLDGDSARQLRVGGSIHVTYAADPM